MVRRASSARSARWSSSTTRAGSQRAGRPGKKQAELAQRPCAKRAAGAIGDIGSHAENLVATVTGLEIESLCADLSSLRARAARSMTTPACCCVSRRRARRADRIADQHRLENDLRLRVSGDARHAGVASGATQRIDASPHDGPKRVFTRGAPGSANRRGARAACRPGIPKASSKPSRTSTGASSPISAHGRRAWLPIRWRPTIRAWRTVRAGCVSSNAP